MERDTAAAMELSGMRMASWWVRKPHYTALCGRLDSIESELPTQPHI